MDRAPDQAAGLRRMLARSNMRVIPLASVLERPAQARLAVHLAAGLGQLGNRVVILDASKGDVPNAVSQRPRYELLHLLQGEKDYDDVVLFGPDGVRIVPATRGIESMEHADDTGWSELFGAFTALSEAPDVVLLNCAPGDAHPACRAAGGTHEVVLALNGSPDSVTAAYTLIKTGVRADGQRRYRLVFADTPADFDAAPLAARMIDAARRFLGADLRPGGVLPRDGVIGTASRQTIVSSDPAHPAAVAFLTLAGASTDWGLPEFSRPAALQARGHSSRS